MGDRREDTYSKYSYREKWRKSKWNSLRTKSKSRSAFLASNWHESYDAFWHLGNSFDPEARFTNSFIFDTFSRVPNWKTHFALMVFSNDLFLNYFSSIPKKIFEKEKCVCKFLWDNQVIIGNDKLAAQSKLLNLKY